MMNIFYNKVLRRVLGVSLFFLFTFLPSSAQRLIVEQNTIDVGKTGYNVPVTATFELYNKGSKSMTISNVKPDCGCTKVEWPRGTIAGGERFRISVTYDARMLGHFEKQAAVIYSGHGEPLYLTMRGVVEANHKDYSQQYPYDFAGLLAQVGNIEFDDVNKGDTPSYVIKVLNNTATDVTPNLLHLPSWLTAVAQPESLSPGEAGTITVALNSLQLSGYGLTQQSVYLGKALDEKVRADIEMPVSVVLLPDLTAFEGVNRQNAPQLKLSTDHLNLGQQGGKYHNSGIITLTNSGRSPLIITSLQMFTGGMTVTLNKRELKPGESAKLKVKMEGDQSLQSRTKPRVLMITNDPERSKVVININVK